MSSQQRPEPRCWDSSVFLAWLKPEPERHLDCAAIVKQARAGTVLIVTSAITLTEVIKLPGGPSLSRDHEKKIQDFFKQGYISVRDLDRFTAELARDLIWSHPHLQPKDSIHVATAMRWKIPVLETYDESDLLSLDGKIGNPALRIRKPHISEQRELPFRKER